MYPTSTGDFPEKPVCESRRGMGGEAARGMAWGSLTVCMTERVAKTSPAHRQEPGEVREARGPIKFGKEKKQRASEATTGPESFRRQPGGWISMTNRPSLGGFLFTSSSWCVASWKGV